MLVHFPLATPAGRHAHTREAIDRSGDGGATFIARVHPQTTAREGEQLRLVVDTKRLHFFESVGGLAIYA